MSDSVSKLVAVGIFCLTYLLIILFYRRKTLLVWAAVAALLILRIVSIEQALRSISWNVVLLYFGMLLVSEVFLYSKMPDCLATILAGRANRTGIAMVLLCLFTGFLSIALENVAVVLLVAPIALSIARKCDINPVPLFIGMAISSNLQGAATLIGDPPSMLLAGHAGFSFNDFFVLDGRPGIFFAIQVGALVSAPVLFLFFRKYDRKMPTLAPEMHLSVVPTVIVFLLIAALVASSSIAHEVQIMAGLICCIFGLLSFAWYLLREKAKGLPEFLGKLDWQTGIFLMGIFVLVHSLAAVGLLEDIAQTILSLSGGSYLAVFLAVVWISVLLSAFIDNVPYLMAMLPVIGFLSARLTVNSHPLYFGLLIGASIGGNITPIGASANIVAMGILKKQGHEVSFLEFVRLGLPFTVASVAAASLFIWFTAAR